MSGIAEVSRIKDGETKKSLRDVIETLNPIAGIHGLGKKYVSNDDLVSLGLANKGNNGKIIKRDQGTSQESSDSTFLNWLSTDYQKQVFNKATFVIGTETANVINVSAQMQDVFGNNISSNTLCFGYFSSSSDGASFTASPVDTSVAIGTEGSLYNIDSTRIAFHFISNSSGLFDIDITHAGGAKTLYFVLQNANSGLVTSAAITFT